MMFRGGNDVLLASASSFLEDKSLLAETRKFKLSTSLSLIILLTLINNNLSI